MAPGMEALAREPNVHVKVSEFGLKDQPWDYESNRRVVLDALAIFGVERAMFATNFPVAGLRIGYGALVDAMSRMLAHLSPDRARPVFLEKRQGVLSLIGLHLWIAAQHLAQRLHWASLSAKPRLA